MGEGMAMIIYIVVILNDEDENGHGDNSRHDFGLILSRSPGPPTSNQPSDISCHFQITHDFTQTLIEPKTGMKTFC